MKHSSQIIEMADGTAVFTQQWEPAERAKTAVLCLHGWGDHGGRYTHVGEAFAQAGMVFTAVDLRGHGQTKGPRGYLKSYKDQMFPDIDHILAHLQQRFPHIPQVLYGHSTGGGIALGYAIQRQPKVAGIIASSPWLMLYQEPSKGMVRLMRLIRTVYPKFTRELGYTDGVLSRDPAVDVAGRADQLMHSSMSAGLFVEAVNNGRYVLKNADKITPPLLLMHGTADKVTSPIASQQVTNNAPHAIIKLWPDALHELQHEINKDEIIAYMIAWVEGLAD
jgi:alpha-beta hydrolase superfamily lysophospholipase